MRQAATQREIVERADLLANQLTVGPTPVERNTLLSVVANFLADPSSEPARLARTLALLDRGNGGHLDRSPAFGRQVRLVIRVIGDLLREPNIEAGELRSLLGWTARLLLVRRPARPDAGPAGSTAPGVRPGSSLPPRYSPLPPPRRPTRAVSTPRPEAVSSQPQAPAWRARLQGLGWGNAGPIVAALLTELQSETRAEAAQEIIVRLDRRELKRRKDKPWVQDLFEAAGEKLS